MYLHCVPLFIGVRAEDGVGLPLGYETAPASGECDTRSRLTRAWIRIILRSAVDGRDGHERSAKGIPISLMQLALRDLTTFTRLRETTMLNLSSSCRWTLTSAKTGFKPKRVKTEFPRR